MNPCMAIGAGPLGWCFPQQTLWPPRLLSIFCVTWEVCSTVSVNLWVYEWQLLVHKISGQMLPDAHSGNPMTWSGLSSEISNEIVKSWKMECFSRQKASQHYACTPNGWTLGATQDPLHWSIPSHTSVLLNIRDRTENRISSAQLVLRISWSLGKVKKVTGQCKCIFMKE